MIHNTADLLLERFQTIIELTRIKKSQHELNLIELAKIKEQIINAELAASFEHFGSYTKLSAMKGSDFDLLAIMPFVRDPKSIMNYLKDNLSRNLDKKYKIKIEYPSLSIDSSFVKFDIVPASPVKPLIGNRPELMILKNEEELMRINPTFQLNYIEGKYTYHKDKFATLIQYTIGYVSRIFNYWKSCHKININIPTFYVQLIMAGHWQYFRAKTFSSCLYSLFSALDKLMSMGKVFDPYATLIKEKSTIKQNYSKTLIELINKTSINCLEAITYERMGESEFAIKYWNKIFNNKFPEKGTKREDIGWGQNDDKNDRQ